MELFCPTGGVKCGLVAADEYFAAAVVGLHDELFRQAVPVDVFSALPNAIEGDEQVFQAALLHVLADTVFVGQQGPLGGVAVELEPVDFFVDVAGMLPVEVAVKLLAEEDAGEQLGCYSGQRAVYPEWEF